MNRKLTIGIGIAVFLYVGMMAKTFFGQPSDQVLIKQALDAAVADAREGKTGKVMELLSSKAMFAGADIPRGEVGNYIKNAKPDFTIITPTPIIEGDKAVIVSPVDVSLKVAIVSTPPVRINSRIELTKEKHMSFFLVPTSSWKITKIEADGTPPEL